MLELKNNTLSFHFPEIHPEARVSVVFNRTLRIPDDGRTYPLPPGLGYFPIKHVDDYRDKVPAKWVQHGGVMLPMWQSEAMWLQFIPHTPHGHMHAWPFAIKVSTGKRSAVTGKPWSKLLREGDYCIEPEQPWLSCYGVEIGIIRQFVAAPLGMGVTAEEQITGKAEFGGLQIEVFPMRTEEFLKRWPKIEPQHHTFRRREIRSCGFSSNSTDEEALGFAPDLLSQTLSEDEEPGILDFEPQSYNAAPAAATSVNYCADNIRLESPTLSRGVTTKSCALNGETKTSGIIRPDMGLAPGGKMAQQVFADAYGLDCWSRDHHDRCFVHLSNSLAWKAITDQDVPTMPFTAADYSRKGYPWYDHYREDVGTVKPNSKLAGLKSVVQMGAETGIPVVLDNESAQPQKVVHTGHVRDGKWG